MQIKIFNFIVSSPNPRNIVCPERIEEEINSFLDLSQAEVIAIKTTTVTTHQHNNGGEDTVKLIYTILYK